MKNKMKLFLCPRHYFFLRSRCFSSGAWLASWSSEAVRTTFIDYFKLQGHEFVSSSNVIPKRREGVYFTNAGMNQFKPIILGEVDPRSKYQKLVRAVNSQKCIRVGGKHNDLDDVGHDLTHHTFFEMLGNWSFGDYFKTEACRMALELLTKYYGIPIERLYFTYFAGDELLNLPSDDECKNSWLSLGIPKGQVLPFGAKDNFWDMGVTGPCGPCTEIHYDHVGGRNAGAEVNSGSPNVVEIWNLVFMQYNRQKNQSLKQLPTFHVDTGMGLERMTAVLNQTTDNYSTDLFLPLFEVIQKHSNSPPYESNKETINTNYRLLADHTRMFTIAISDGLLPSHRELGHKLRIILHRCFQLCRNSFHVSPDVLLPSLVSVVVQSLGSTYPELYNNEQMVCAITLAAIEHYNRQREQAAKSFNKFVSKFANVKELPAEVITALEIGTYGTPVPIDMIVEEAKARGLTLDLVGYEMLQQERMTHVSTDPLTASPDASSTVVSDLISQQVPQTNDSFKYHYVSLTDGEYDFSGMCQATCPSHVQGLSRQGELVFKLEEGDVGEIILDKTCFYAEAGGQEADTGSLSSETGEFLVSDVQQNRGYVVHYGHMVKGCLQIGQTVKLDISQASRAGCMRNHTATHLLHSALSEVIPSTQQQGSAVTPYRFTFDFLALTPVDVNQIKKIEDDVRDMTKREYPVSRRVMPLDKALQLPHLKKLQNQEYPCDASVVIVQTHDGELSLSSELCCGTHVVNTSHIGDFCITGLSTKSQNVKHVTCVTGQDAVQAHQQGSITQAICLLLRNVVESREITNAHLQKLASLIKQTCAHIESRTEKYQHSLSYSCENKSRLRDLIGENNKARSFCDGVGVTVAKLLEGSSEREDTMKELVAHINKVQQLELVPKTSRDEAFVCLENLEHKVAEAVNRRGTNKLFKMLEAEMEEQEDTSPIILQVDQLDVSPRQLVKALSQKALHKLIVLIKKNNRNVYVIFSIPSFSARKFMKDELEKVFSLLGCFGNTKGKLSTEMENLSIYTVVVQADVDSADVMCRLRQERLFV